jgi:hypothetical protein
MKRVNTHLGILLQQMEKAALLLLEEEVYHLEVEGWKRLEQSVGRHLVWWLKMKTWLPAVVQLLAEDGVDPWWSWLKDAARWAMVQLLAEDGVEEMLNRWSGCNDGAGTAKLGVQGGGGSFNGWKLQPMGELKGEREREA